MPEANVFDADEACEHSADVDELGDVVGPLPVGLCIATVPEGNVVWANGVFEEIVGRPPSPAISVRDAAWSYQVYDREGRLYPAERFPYSAVVRTRAPATADDVVVLRPDGTKAFLRVHARPVFDRDGDLVRVSIAFVDITQQVHAESEREHTAVQLKLALEHAPIIVWAVSRDGDVLLAQGAGLAALESRVGPLLGKNVFEAFPNERAGVQQALEKAFLGHSFKIVGRLGGATLDTWIAPSYGTEGEVVGANGVSHDVGALRQLEFVAMQADRTRAIGVLSASVAHEINNPLTYMLPCADYIAVATCQLVDGLGQASDEAVRALMPTVRQLADDVAVLQAGMQRIATIANDLRSFAHTTDEEAAAVDTSAVVRSVLQLIGKEAATRAHLAVSLDATKPVFGHASRLIQVVLNLVTNALHATVALPKPAAKILIRTLDEGEHIVLEILGFQPWGA